MSFEAWVCSHGFGVLQLAYDMFERAVQLVWSLSLIHFCRRKPAHYKVRVLYRKFCQLVTLQLNGWFAENVMFFSCYATGNFVLEEVTVQMESRSEVVFNHNKYVCRLDLFLFTAFPPISPCFDVPWVLNLKSESLWVKLEVSTSWVCSILPTLICKTRPFFNNLYIWPY